MTENLTRAYQKIFAKNAGAQGKTVFGSTAQGNTQYTTDISAMQSEAYENGFADAVVSKKAPVLQDFNTVENITTRQLAYLFQKGIPEWDSETTYFKGNIVLNIESDIPVLYYSLIDNNLNNEVSDTESWKKLEFGNNSNQIIGQIIPIPSTASYTPFGCLACDGAEYTKAQFNDLWTNYLTADTPLLETCTYEDYQQDITNNGFCEKFAIDTDNNKFKVPTLNNVIYQNTDITLPVVGNGKVLGLTNGTTTGGLSADDYNAQRLMASTGVPVGSDVSTTSPTSGSTIKGKFGVVQEANNSGLIAQNKVNASLKFFVVVANGEINQSQMDWAAWATGLNGKANTDLNNVANNIDYIIERGSNENGWYEKYKSGKIRQGGQAVGNDTYSNTLTFPTPFTNTNYIIYSGAVEQSGNVSGGTQGCFETRYHTGDKTTTTVKWQTLIKTTGNTYVWISNIFYMNWLAESY